MERRFTALRITAAVIRILAWIVLILGLLTAVALLVGAVLGELEALDEYGLPVLTPLGAGVGFVTALLFAVMEFIILYALADLLHVLLAVEENTRALRLWTERQASMGTGYYAAPSAPYPSAPYYTPPTVPSVPPDTGVPH